MPTISFNNSMKSEILQWLFTNSSSTSARGYSIYNSVRRSHVAMYSGTPPTDFSGLTDSNSTAGGTILWYKQESVESNTHWSITIPTNATVTLTTGFEQAVATGTASWFRIWGTGDGVANSTDSHDMVANHRSQLVGTIGTEGSGADLILPTTNIVSGKYYRIQNLKFNLPTDFTY